MTNKTHWATFAHNELTGECMLLTGPATDAVAAQQERDVSKAYGADGKFVRLLTAEDVDAPDFDFEPLMYFCSFEYEKQHGHRPLLD